jgi:hypothetical protein
MRLRNVTCFDVRGYVVRVSALVLAGPGGVKRGGCSKVSFVLLLLCLRNRIIIKDFLMSVQREKPIYLIICFTLPVMLL